jgi:hypothetical protein
MVALEQALDVVPSPPPPGPVGPDRLQAAVALRLGNDGFALFPGGQKSPALPLAGDVSFVGLPVLDGPLANTTFFVSARAVTGVVGAAPMSVVGSVQTNTTAFPIVVDGFVGIPSLTTPAPGAPWNGTQLATKFGPGAPVDLTVIDATSGSGLVRWTIAIPGGARAVTLPDLREFPGEGLPSGPVVLGVYGARIDGFDYAKLRYRNLRPAGMTAYGLDYVDVVLP